MQKANVRDATTRYPEKATSGRVPINCQLSGRRSVRVSYTKISQRHTMHVGVFTQDRLAPHAFLNSHFGSILLPTTTKTFYAPKATRFPTDIYSNRY